MISRIKDSVEVLALIAICITFIAMWVIAYLYMKPYKISDVWIQPMPVVEKQVLAGNSVSYIAEYCRYISINADVAKSMISVDWNHSVLLGTDPRSSLPSSNKNCNSLNPDRIVIGNLVPKNTTPWKYYLQVEVKYPILPLRIDAYTFKTDTFEVVESL